MYFLFQQSLNVAEQQFIPHNCDLWIVFAYHELEGPCKRLMLQGYKEYFAKELTHEDPGLSELEVNLQVHVEANSNKGNIRSRFFFEQGELRETEPNTCRHMHTRSHTHAQLLVFFLYISIVYSIYSG